MLLFVFACSRLSLSFFYMSAHTYTQRLQQTTHRDALASRQHAVFALLDLILSPPSLRPRLRVRLSLLLLSFLGARSLSLFFHLLFVVPPVQRLLVFLLLLRSN